MKKNDDVDYQPKPNNWWLFEPDYKTKLDNNKPPKRTRRQGMPNLIKHVSMVSDEHSRGVF